MKMHYLTLILGLRSHKMLPSTNKLKIIENRDIVLMRRDFKICTWSYFSVEEYNKIINQRSDLYKPASFLTTLN